MKVLLLLLLFVGTGRAFASGCDCSCFDIISEKKILVDQIHTVQIAGFGKFDIKVQMDSQNQALVFRRTDRGNGLPREILDGGRQSILSFQLFSENYFFEVLSICGEQKVRTGRYRLNLITLFGNISLVSVVPDDIIDSGDGSVFEEKLLPLF